MIGFRHNERCISEAFSLYYIVSVVVGCKVHDKNVFIGRDKGKM